MMRAYKIRSNSLRLSQYDYSQAVAYFITCCSYQKKCIFGEIIEEPMHHNELGIIVNQTWQNLTNYFSNIILDEFIIMPNHLHAIIFLEQTVGAELAPPMRFINLSRIMQVFKSICTVTINKQLNKNKVLVWQRGYYDHIIRNEFSLNKIREYIVNNPLKWSFDRENPERNLNFPLNNKKDCWEY